MILIIDNYDSFTFNLAQELGSMGLEVEVRRNDAFTLEELEKMPLRTVVLSLAAVLLICTMLRVP